MSDTAPLWLHLHFPLLPLELGYSSDDPGPAALLDERNARLWLCNQAAAQEGLQPGMALSTACSLCPGVTLLPRHPQQEPRQLESLALWAGNFSAQVALQPPFGLLLEIASMLHYFQGLERLRQQLRKALATLCFSTRVATGHTPLAAGLLARHQHRLDPTGGDLLHATPQDHLALLHQLPLTALELGARTTERLTGMGLQRLEQLLCLPRQELAARLGPALPAYLDRLTGRRPDPPRYFQPPPRFQRRLELGHEATSTEALLFPLRRLLAELEGYLRHRQLQALQLQLQLLPRAEEGGIRVRLGHGEGEHQSVCWMELCRLRLERVELTEPVLALELRVEYFREQAQGGADLFAAPAAGESKHQLLSRLQTRLGDAAILRPGLAADHRPERAWQALRPDQPAPALSTPPGRPSWLLAQPEPLAVEEIGRGIQLLQGPERIVSGWWDSQPVRRDYYTGRWPDGRQGWLYRDDRGDWYLQGWFG